MRARRGVSEIIAAVALIALVAVGAAFVYNYYQSSSAAAAKANVMVLADTVGGYIQVTVKNMGSAAVEIQQVSIDGTDITADLGWTGAVLEPGKVLQGTVQDPGLAPGSHTITVVYTVDGNTLEAVAEFTK